MNWIKTTEQMPPDQVVVLLAIKNPDGTIYRVAYCDPIKEGGLRYFWHPTEGHAVSGPVPNEAILWCFIEAPGN